MDVWKGSANVGCDVEKMNSIEVKHIGQTIEWTTVWRGNKNVVVSCVRDVRSKPPKIDFETQLAGSRLADNCG